MKIRIYALLILIAYFAKAAAQDHPAIPTIQPYGKIDKADLEMTSCDFEKSANAEVLFDIGKMTDGYMERHIRVKVFNSFGANSANFRLQYTTLGAKFAVNDIQGETFNLVNGAVEITPLDKKDVYVEKTNSFIATVVFPMPNVKARSVFEFVSKGYFGGTWYFQNNIPTRYSEIKTDFSSSAISTFKFVPYVTMPYVKDIGTINDYKQVKAMAYVPSLPEEPFTSSKTSGLQRIEYMSIYNNFGSWQSIGEFLSRWYDRDQFIDVAVTGESDIVAHAKQLKSQDEKIAYIFDYVKNYINWNKKTDFLAEQSTAHAWNKKTGNSAEINWIVFHLLKKAGIKSYPVITADKSYGKINPALPDIFLLRNMAVLIPIDSTTNYVLDATDRWNMYNTIPQGFLNVFGLLLDRDNQAFNMVFLGTDKPVIQQAFFNMEIMPDGKMSGSAEIASDKYNKYTALENYNLLGEKLYADSIKRKNNSLKISSLKMENMDTDSLPLIQKIEFTQELPGSDESYIYFNPNPFSVMGDNPFKANSRFADIDFGYRQDFSISCMYKIPTGYKTETLPKSITSFMPDKSIFFKRIVAEDNGQILIRYTLDHRKSIYFAKDYADIRAFYKSMYDLLGEQIVLKKS